MKISLLVQLTFTFLAVNNAYGFSPTVKNIAITPHQSHGKLLSFGISNNAANHRMETLLAKPDSSLEEDGGNFFSDLKLNPPYALAYVSFIGLAAYMSSAEPVGASQAVLEKFFADPLNPGVNELFVTVFNLLGIIGLPMACLVMPGAKGQKLPAAPFLFLSSLAGYGSLGIYMSTTQSQELITNKSELGWFTQNVLENKIFNWFVVAILASAYVTTGTVSAAANDVQGLIAGFTDVISSSALGFASTVDFTILSLTAASLIPEDLKRRGVTGANVNAIAASTLLLPGVGLGLYCALRPNLEE